MDATEIRKAREIRARNRAGISDGNGVMEPEMESRIIPFQVPELTLVEGYQRYKEGRGFGRGDLYALIISKINELERRIGSVDEAAVQAIEQRVASLETVIGHALQARPMEAVSRETMNDLKINVVRDGLEKKRKGWPKGKKRGPRVTTGASTDG